MRSRLTFELPPTGGIQSRGEFGTVKLLRYITPGEYALMGAEFVFAAFVLYYLVEEFIEIKALRLEYFTAFWNCLDLFMIVVRIRAVAVRFPPVLQLFWAQLTF